jgi:hypothetical protein
MAESFKVLGQVYLNSGSVLSDGYFLIYSVPTKSDAKYALGVPSQAIVSSIVVCNREDSANAYNLAVVPNGETGPSFQHVIFASKSIDANETHVISIGLGMQTGDALYAQQNTDNKKFTVSAFGIEIV